MKIPRTPATSLSTVRRYVEALGASLDVTVVPLENSDAYAAQRSVKPLSVTE